MRLIIAFFVIFTAPLLFNLAHSAPQERTSIKSQKNHTNEARSTDRKKKKVDKVSKKIKHTSQETEKKKRLAAKLAAKNTSDKSKKKVSKATIKVQSPKKSIKRGYGKHYAADITTPKLASHENLFQLSSVHKKRYQHAKKTAMTKLMSQVGKPYQWGGASPTNGFDCSGLIYYAYKDVVKIKMPRTANEMYHLRDAAPIKKNQLETGDLVFFRINNHGTTDHVGVYLGSGKFIQSPRAGQEIRISQLDSSYWQDHYVGARRVVTPKTIR